MFLEFTMLHQSMFICLSILFLFYMEYVFSYDGLLTKISLYQERFKLLKEFAFLKLENKYLKLINKYLKLKRQFCYKNKYHLRCYLLIKYGLFSLLIYNLIKYIHLLLLTYI